MNHLLWLVKQDKYFMSLIQLIKDDLLERRSLHGNHDEDCLDILEKMSFSSKTIQDKDDDVVDDIHAI